MNLERLIYRSVMKRPATCAELEAILATSLWNNARWKITGALGHCSGHYIQLLEGSPAALNFLLAKLHEDDRHGDLVILDRRPADHRLLPGWTMARADIALSPTRSYALELLGRDDAGDEWTDTLVDMVRTGETSVA